MLAELFRNKEATRALQENRDLKEQLNTAEARVADLEQQLESKNGEENWEQ